MEQQRTFREERPDLEAHLKKINQNRQPISLLLDRIHDIRNVGAIFRLADAARIRKVYFLGEPAWKLDSKKVERVSRYASRYVPYEVLNSLEAVAELKKNHNLIAMEWTNQSIPYTSFAPLGETILILGNEQHGVSPELLELAEQSIHIPMLGVNTSMNVACAAGIVVYGMLEKFPPFVQI